MDFYQDIYLRFLKIVRCTLILMLGIGCLWTTLAAQNLIKSSSSKVSHYNLSLIHNLPMDFNQAVTSCAQSADGLIFIGTEQGVYQFDGFRLHAIIKEEDRYKIGPIVVKSMLFYQNELWILTLSGLIQLDQNFRLKRHWKYGDGSGLPSNHGHSIMCDNNGVLWVCTDNRNPVYHERESDAFCEVKWSEYVKSNEITTKQYLNVYSILPAKDDHLWFFTNIGLFSFSKSSNSFKFISNDKVGRQLKMTNGLDNHDGKLYINMAGDGLSIYDYTKNQFDEYNAYSEVADTDNLPFWSLVKTWKNTILVACRDGLYEFNIDNNSWSKPLFYRPYSNEYRLLKGISLFKDIDKSIWIGTNEGLLRLDQFYNQIDVISHRYFEDLTISGFYTDKASGISYIGFKDKSPVVAFSETQPSQVSEIGNFEWVKKILSDNEGKIWIISHNNIHYYNPKRKVLKEIKLPDKNSFRFTDALFDKNDNLWVSSIDHSLLNVVKNTSFATIHDIHDPYGNSKMVQCLTLDPIENNIWFGHWAGYLGRYFPLTQNAVQYSHFPDKPSTLGIPLPTRMIFETDSTLLITGQGGGLTRMTKSGDSISFQNNLYQNLLPTTLLYDFTLDPKGGLWASSGSGLLYLSKSRDVKIFDSEFSIVIPSDAGPLFNTSDGNIILGMKGRYIKMHYENLIENNIIPKIFIKNININGKLINPKIPNESPLTLPYDKNNFEFNYGVSTYVGMKNYTYYYRMIGIDTSWIEMSNPGNINFSNMNHGNYFFQLRVCNESGYCNSVDSEFKFVINAHFSRSWWFRLLVFCVVAILLYGLYRYRLAQVIHIEKVRNRIAADLHDDVASTVSSISFYSDFAKSQLSDDNPTLHNILDKIGENARESLETMRDVIWSTQANFDSFSALKSKLKQYGEGICLAKDIKFTWTDNVSENQMFISPIVRRNVYLIVKEAINNAVKHAHCSEISVSFFVKNSVVELIITDNGKGFDHTKIKSGNGILNIKNRADQLHATVTIKSDLGQGTTIKARLKAK